MRVRDAIETDAAALASMTGRPRGVVRDMIHDRSVRVATGDESVGDESAGDGSTGDDGDTAESAAAGAEGDDGEGTETPADAVRGFVAFDVRGGTVHVTNFGGEPDAVGRLFEEPVRFASREGMAVEAVVPTDGDAPETVESIGFEAVGRGPRIEGASTTRYRLEPDAIDVGEE
jgi:hypothetical protein